MRLGFAPAICTAIAMACSGVYGQQTPPPAKPGVFSPMRCTKLPMPTQMLGSAVIGKRLYAFGGGNTLGWSNSVISAEILDNGGLGQWRDETPMIERRAYIGNSIEVVNNKIYVVGGSVAADATTSEAQTTYATDVLFTSVQSDGTLAPWKKSQPFPAQAISCVATCSTDNQLFVVGGHKDKDVFSEILGADFGPDGMPQNWHVVTKMPVPLWFHGAAILADRIYVWGGLTSNSVNEVNARVFSSEVSKDGKLGVWQEETAMPNPVYSAAFCGFNDYLICVAGRYKGGWPENAIWFARLQDKRVTQWQALETDLDTRIYHSLGLDKSRGWIFVTGGRFKPGLENSKGKVLDTVQAFQIAQPKESKMDSPTAPQQTAAASASGTTPVANGGTTEFKTADAALAEAKRTGKQAMLFFYSPEVPASKRFRDNVINTPAFASVAQSYVLGAVDASKGDATYSYKYSVFKVPCLVIIGPDGTAVKTSRRLETMDGLRDFLNSPAQ